MLRSGSKAGNRTFSGICEAMSPKRSETLEGGLEK